MIELDKRNTRLSTESILIVSNGGFIKGLYSFIDNVPPDQMNGKYSTSNCSLSLLEIEGNELRKTFYNNVEHLSLNLPPLHMRIILIRHGRTVENDAGILQGHLPGTLSENGWNQARKVAERLKSEKIDYVYSSDLARSANTAKEIMRYHPETPIEFTEELRETFLGGWQGKTKAEVAFFNSPEGQEIAPKDFESPEAVTQRVENFLKKILSFHKDDIVLLVGHNGVNKKLVGVLLGEDPIESLKNTSISIFEIDNEGKVVIILFNCTKHLD